MSHRVIVAVTCALVALAIIEPSPAAAAPCWRPPVSGWITDGFRAPSCPYCAGNRGIEYRVGRSATVRAVSSGNVTYSGSIAGTRYVVVEHSNGWKVTYGKLTSTGLRRGDRVAARSIVGRAAREAYFGLRIDGRYRDPAPYLGRLAGRPRLVPVDGTTPRQPPAPRWRCGI